MTFFDVTGLPASLMVDGLGAMSLNKSRGNVEGSPRG
ncbi:MAG: hypothetical protein CM15mP18_5330 [Methanobacteriota archaeon]|nr:MAG: hypothetical protein CM15mP18_5330 [Euryarchaeota archaeon]